ncbi:hypothetical protein [Buttiauxella noackiae]|uniref:hypothetical protein n=1 Tax=Buttiauxella noackiae TaxID=82992 RepID=UPI002352A59B|nr:hypothetical protein [Buttiauxella noackiae]MCA1920798.1 hypothetical protein [Buttiauxella noackiae]
MIKNAFVEKNSEGNIVVRVEDKQLSTFDDYNCALEWAFSIGYRVYKKEPTNDKQRVLG